MDEKTGYIIGGVVAVVGAILAGIPKYDAYNERKAKAARDAEEELLAAERRRVQEEAEARAKEKAEINAEWEKRFATFRVEMEGKVNTLQGEVNELRTRVRRHEHRDAANRQTMYVAAVALKGIVGAEDVMQTLMDAAKVGIEVTPDPKEKK